MIDTKLLHGFSIEEASCYGMPHLGAYYMADDVNQYRRTSDTCVVCGKRATNTHHHPPKGVARTFTLHTERGMFKLKPSLIAVCGSGTTGCHGLIHDRKVQFRWKWKSEEIKEKWFKGYYLSHGYAPHQGILYNLGCWQVGDGTTWVDIGRNNG